MAIQRWTDGGADGDWGNAANWTSAVPVTGDTVIIDSSSRTILTGLDQSLVNLAALKIRGGFTGDIGASGNLLKIAVATSPARTIITGGRNIWLEAAANDITNAYFNQTLNDAHLRIQGDFVRIGIGGGRVTAVGGLGALSDLVVARDRTTSVLPWFTVPSGVAINATALLHYLSGAIDLNGSTGALRMRNVGARVTLSSGAFSGTNVVDQYGGDIVLDGGDYDGRVLGGFFDASQPKESSVALFRLAANGAVVDFTGLDTAFDPPKLGNPVIYQPEAG